MQTTLRLTGTTLTLIILINLSLFAQAPEKMSYQAVVRGATGDLVTNKTVGVRISILQGSVTGDAVYVETHMPTTNANGLVSLVIGTGTIVNGSFPAINWAPSLNNSIAGPFFVRSETDPSGGNNYTISGTNQLLSVPYALHAKTATTTSLAFGHFYTQASVGDMSVLPRANINFFNSLPNNTNIDRNFFGHFYLSNPGTYQVLFKVNTVGQGAVILTINEVELPYTRVASSPGSSELIGIAQITTVTEGGRLALINASFNSALTVAGYDVDGNEIISSITVTQIH
ncbi:hypothetical protein [Dyadobacter arcticus]|uniref:C1q domain-containing protein n=1 Tax=Dyadobacter arcticus TaxID=1078754 RepID=A0ABX0UMN8_9BACT|nr:hypothetical protein [Dyadobacter arcticus]NIJ52890.1 hypothetical protein [Dyadobacter arcticus]